MLQFSLEKRNTRITLHLYHRAITELPAPAPTPTHGFSNDENHYNSTNYLGEGSSFAESPSNTESTWSSLEKRPREREDLRREMYRGTT